MGQSKLIAGMKASVLKTNLHRAPLGNAMSVHLDVMWFFPSKKKNNLFTEQETQI